MSAMSFFWSNPVASLQENQEPSAWYVFRYEKGERLPRQRFGPYATQDRAQARVQSEVSRRGHAPQRYRIRRLTRTQAKRIWGR